MGVRQVAGRPAVFLDRDGVLNAAIVRDGKPFPPRSLEELHVAADTKPALERLRERGYLLFVITNQPDVARGSLARAIVDAIDDRLRALLPLDDVFVCDHDGDECACRKPKPGLLLDAQHRYGIDMAASWCIGDRWKDVEAARRAGVRSVFIDYAYREPFLGGPPDKVVNSLTQAVDAICKEDLMLAPSASGLTPSVAALKVKVFADGADKASMLRLLENPLIAGFTTNPTLMQKSGITDYEAFARDILATIDRHPISFEVFADDEKEMERQARLIATWGENVYVKIPVTNTKRESMAPLVKRLSHDGIRLNVTALMTLAQVTEVTGALAGGAPANISVFAGRIADTGRDPMPIMRDAVAVMAPHPQLELIWASPRELLNVFHADACGVHIITVTHDVLAKLQLVGKDLHEYSLDTVKMFHADAQKAGFVL